ncbi:UDP-forming cellulose synthase catalytic subunit [Catenovulum sp. 2E275]|uniref:UDP-forming cellulose synthase catalytic subunit n=1 Tax=Catenovulum sp. 2E275 TaxID=2980497 RepID=UPI0021D23A25|nr:UDP-forming cellulose synthase catalytic subunit [Catenovulum sp. 2E275]MCU4677043.1 UDP-forming cellulose synthase catalytic subunit [Catenovulum sp. 2E275]
MWALLNIPQNWPMHLKIAAILVQPKYIRLYKFRVKRLFEEYRVTRLSALILPIFFYFISCFIKFRAVKKSTAKRRFYQLYPQLKPNQLSFFDPLRFIIQSLYLLLSKPNSESDFWHKLSYFLRKAWVKIRLFDRFIIQKSTKIWPVNSNPHNHTLINSIWRFHSFRWLTYLLISVVLFVFISVPFTISAQAAFMGLILLVAYPMRKVPGQLATIIMITLSLISSSRYLWWRFNETLGWQDWQSTLLGTGLIIAESYAWLVLLLGYFQTINPLKRAPVALPDNPDLWPSVDVYIPTYNEPLSVVKPTTLAALSLDWPQDKLNVYILDDGCRESFKEFADSVGAGYIIRDQHIHAKAGNMNHAMQHTKGEYIAIFDCDHIPARSFLQLTMGQFLKDKKVCLVQTPHHFFSADPFEKNLKNHTKVPNENMLFYGLIQDGNDMWNATFFCGSCAVLKREALESIGGFAFDTVTEDAHTALRMQRQGYKTTYINIPQAAGLATDSLSAHVGQRIRWARGMAQIFRIDNPLLGKGLQWRQRLCYLNAMLHFLSGIPRIIFLTAPLALIFFNAYIIHAEFLAIMLYVIPTLMQIKITNSRIQGKYRYSFWGEVYESVLAWYILKPTTVALFNPSKGKFNVTEKGGLNNNEFYDWNISTPSFVLFSINLVGFIIATFRLFFEDPQTIGVLLISMAWTAYNLVILGAAIAVAAEAKQIRASHRVQANIKGNIRLKNGHTLQCTVTDYSDKSVGLEVVDLIDHTVKPTDEIDLLLMAGKKQAVFTTKVVNRRDNQLGLLLTDMPVERQKEFVLATFARADAWIGWQKQFQHDRPSFSFKQIRHASWRGVNNMLFHAPVIAKPFVNLLIMGGEFIYSLLPKQPKQEPKNEYF